MYSDCYGFMSSRFKYYSYNKPYHLSLDRTGHETLRDLVTRTNTFARYKTYLIELNCF